jgi:hypothetical protein
LKSNHLATLISTRFPDRQGEKRSRNVAAFSESLKQRFLQIRVFNFFLGDQCDRSLLFKGYRL